MRFRFFTLPALAVLILGALTLSCSKEQNLLDAIPSDVEHAGTIRLKSLMEQVGCRFADGKAELPQGMDIPFAQAIAAIDAAGVANTDEIAWATVGKRDVYATMLVSDKAKFKEATAGDIEWLDETGGYACGKIMNTAVVLLGDDRVWITFGAKPDEAVKGVESLLKSAKESAISSMTGVDRLLRSDNLVNVAVRQSSAADKGKKSGVKGENPELQAVWATFTGNVKDNKIVGRSTVMEADGKVIPFKGLTTVNPAVLSYVPGNFNVALALGVTPEFDWSSVAQLVGSMGGFQARGMIAAVTPYLQALDGTVLLAAGPANDQAYGDIDPGNWNFILMARLPQDKINDIMGMMRSSLFMAGVSPKMEKDGIMVIPQYGMDIYAGNVDGYFAVSNLPFDPNRQNQLTPLFNGKFGAISVSLPALDQIGFGMPSFGVDLRAQITSESGEITVSLSGTDKPILSEIFKVLL